MPSDITIFEVRRIHTMNPARPTATHVAVRDGRVVPLTDSLFSNVSPAWSLDGRWVYYVSNRYGPRDIFAQPMAGGMPRGPALRLTTGLNAHTISLSADGRRIAYGDLSIESSAWTIPVPTHPPASSASAVPLTRGAQFVETTLLSRDGMRLTVHGPAWKDGGAVVAAIDAAIPVALVACAEHGLGGLEDETEPDQDAAEPTGPG